MLLVSLLAPFLQVLLLGYAATTDIKNSMMVVCDMDRTAESRDFIRGVHRTRRTSSTVIRSATPPGSTPSSRARRQHRAS